MPFADTTAVVTGGAQGLGLAIAEALAARGTKVAIFDLATDQIAAEVARLREAGGTVNGYTVDASDRGQVQSAVWGDVEYAAFGALLGLPGEKVPQAGSGHALDPLKFEIIGVLARHPKMARKFLAYNGYLLQRESSIVVGD